MTTTQLGVEDEVESKGTLERGLLIGRNMDNRHRPLVIPNALLSNHIALSGMLDKGVSALVENLLVQQTNRGCGWVYFDTRGDTAMRDRLAAWASRTGRADEFLLLAPGRARHSHHYSVLRAGNTHERALRALQALPVTQSADGSDYRQQQGYVLLKAVLGALAEHGRAIGLGALAGLLMQPAHPIMRQALKGELGTEVDPGLQTMARVLASQIARLNEASYGRGIDDLRPEVEFSDVLRHNKMCYVMLPPPDDADPMTASIGRMVLLDFIAALGVRARLPTRLRTPFLAVLNSTTTYCQALSSSFSPLLDDVAFSRATAGGVALAPVLEQEWSALREQDSRLFEQLSRNTQTKIDFWFKAPSHAVAMPSGPADFILTGNADVNYGYLNPREVPPIVPPYERREVSAAEEVPMFRVTKDITGKFA